MSGTPLLAAGSRSTVLVLEDNAMLALDLEEMLRDLGAAEILLASSLAEARRHLDAGLTLALLDFALADGTAEGLAAELEARAIPCLFVTGYTDGSGLPAAMRNRPVLAKPFAPPALEDAIAKGLEARPR